MSDWHEQGRASFTAGRFALAIGALLAFVLTIHGEAVAFGGCPNEAFRTGFGANLPDCRAYEQVSPADKNGVFAQGYKGLVLAAPEGPGLTYVSINGSTIPAPGNSGTNTYPTLLAKRGLESWSSQRIFPSGATGGLPDAVLGFTTNLRYGVAQVVNKDYGHPGAGLGLYLVDTEGGAVTQIVPPENDPEELSYAFDGSSEDGSRIFFESNAAVAPGATEFRSNLYVWQRATGQVSLVGLLPVSEGGEAPPVGSFGGAYEWYNGAENTNRGGAQAGVEIAVSALHAISPSGDQIYFTAAGTGELYLRTGIGGDDPATLRVSTPNAGVEDPNGPRPAAFQEATPDGSHAFFLSSAKLTADATTGAADEGRDLYRYDANASAGDRLRDITPAPDSETPNGAEVQGLLGVSEDGRSGFFIARGVLASGAEPGGENLYHFSEVGGVMTSTFVATLVAEGSGPLWVQPGPERTSRVTPDGEVVMFNSLSPLTDSPSAGTECPGGEPDSRCAEIYRYDAVSNSLICVSCSANGAPPAGPAVFGQIKAFPTSSLVPRAAAVAFPRNMSQSGDQLFFETPQALVGGDTNGATECPRGIDEYGETQACQDVYEWEAAGTPGGSCPQEAGVEGCRFLLSSGQSSRVSYFGNASRDGSDVYILTVDPLVPADTDRAADFYDVRVDGGLASQQSSAAQNCSGEACLDSPSPAPPAAAPSSTQLQAPAAQKPHHKKHKRRHKSHRPRKKRHGSAGATKTHSKGGAGR